MVLSIMGFDFLSSINPISASRMLRSQTSIISLCWSKNIHSVVAKGHHQFTFSLASKGDAAHRLYEMVSEWISNKRHKDASLYLHRQPCFCIYDPRDLKSFCYTILISMGNIIDLKAEKTKLVSSPADKCSDKTV